MKNRLLRSAGLLVTALLLGISLPAAAQGLSNGTSPRGGPDAAIPSFAVQARSGVTVTPVKQGAIPLGEAQISPAQMAKVKALTERPPLPDGPPLRRAGTAQAPEPGTQSLAGPAPKTAAAGIEPPAPMAPSSFLVMRNSTPHPVIPNGFKSNVSEPSTGMAGRVRFMTSNWWAAYTNNDGANWSHLSPFTAFPSADGGFCCDQVVIYDPSRDMMIWYLQYIKSGSGAGDQGRQRIAVFRNTRGGITPGGWITYDILPSAVGGPATGEWLDYPDLALSDDFLWLTTNVFSTTADTFTRSVIIRVPLDNLLAGSPAPLTFYSQNTVGTFKMVQGAKDVMYFASHLDTATMRIFQWPETSGTINIFDRGIPAWISATHSCPSASGSDWCQRSDSRILAGARSWNQLTKQGELWWFWNVAQGGSFPRPYIDAAKFRESGLVRINRPLIWSSTHVYHYIAASSNERGDVGLSVGWGNPPNYYPNSLLCIDDDFNGDPPGWECAASRFGTHGPSINRWGDYLSVRPAYPGGHTWHATGFTQQGGTAGDFTESRSIVFGRERDVREYNRWNDR